MTIGRRRDTTTTPRNPPAHYGSRGFEDVKKFRVRRIVMREEVEAEPTAALSSKVCCVPPDGIGHVGDGLADVLRELAGLDRPVEREDGLERGTTGGGALDQIGRCHVHVAHGRKARTTMATATRLCRTAGMSVLIRRITAEEKRG
jgi:hypothetical protein